MTLLRLLLASLGYDARLHAATALGVIAASAVLTGALLVGDSMRGSLRDLTLDRLGSIQEIAIGDRFFREELTDELKASSDFKKSGYDDAVSAVVIAAASAEKSSGDATTRSSDILLLGFGDDLEKLGGRWKMPRDGEVVLNEPLAAELQARVGDEIALRLPSADQVPADSPLGKKEGRTRSLTGLKVTAVVPAEGLGRFSLRPNQALPKNAWVSKAALQSVLDQSDKVNAIFVRGEHGEAASSDALQSALQPKLEDYGLKLNRITRTFARDGKDETIFDDFQLSSDRMLLDPSVVVAVRNAWRDEKPREIFTYLANRLERIPTDDAQKKAQERRGPVSYSTIAAMQLGAGEGGPLADDEIALVSWAAEDQAAKIGDRVRITYFEPETVHGEPRETTAEFKLKSIVPLTEPSIPYKRRNPAVYDERPTWANDSDLTPEVAGVTDQESIDQWEAPFPVDYKIVRSQDDDYWSNHRTTPKAYVSPAAGKKLWGSRWGDVTAVRVQARPELDETKLATLLLAQMREDDATLGLEFQPIRRRDLAASSGTTPFDVLFLALSFFLVASALLLVALLFRLGIERRTAEVGLLAALGWTRRSIARTLLLEGTIVASLAAGVGMIVGVGYAWLMLIGLRTWWLGAVATPFLTLHITTRSLLIGLLAGILCSVLTIRWSLRSLSRIAVRGLLAGRTSSDENATAIASKRRSNLIPLVCIVLAVICSLSALKLGGEAQAGAFLGGGALTLAAILLLVRGRLQAGGASGNVVGFSIGRLAMRTAARNPSRSLLTLALMAAASFLIVSLSAFRLQPTARGSGGFALLADSAQPILADLNREADRKELLADDASLLSNDAVLAFRLRPGDDAGCRNLYQASQPRVLGVTPATRDYFDRPDAIGFEWAGSAGATTEDRRNPWRLLAPSKTSSDAVPVVIDKNTAMYGLKLYRGIGEEFYITYDDARQPIRFRVVGLLANSVLQGSLLIGEEDFRRLFPSISGYRFFLIQASSDRERTISDALENRLSDQGFDVRRADDVLTDLLAVQNTYLSTFQSLGILSLLLGTFGIAAAQLRGVWERRGELALLRAVGFSRARLSQLVLLENLSLLFAGLGIGTAAALLVVLPHAMLGGIRPPIGDLLLMLGFVALVGGAVGLLAVRGMARVPLLAALRGE